MKTIIKIRASSLSELFDCPARFEAKHINGIYTPTNSRAFLGKAIHASTALYDQAILNKTDMTIEESKAIAIDTLKNPQEDVDWGEDTAIILEPIALSLHEKYCTLIAPKMKYKAVELLCNNLVINDIGIELTGTTDRIYENVDGKLGIADIKTGKTAVAANGEVTTKGHRLQLGIYELLAEHTINNAINAPAKIIGLTTAKTTAGQRVGTGEIIDAKNSLIGDEESPGILQMASQLIHSGSFYGNNKSMLCDKKYCPIYSTCKFK